MPVPPSGEQVVLRHGDQEAVVVEVGGGLRTYDVAGVAIVDGYAAGLACNLFNPKVGVFFVTFLPGLVPHGADVATTSLLFGAIFLVETLIYFAVMILAVERLTRWLRDEGIRRRIERLSGCVLIAFGVRLAVEA